MHEYGMKYRLWLSEEKGNIHQTTYSVYNDAKGCLAVGQVEADAAGQAPKATAAWQHSTKVHCMQICNNSVNPLQFRSYFLCLKPNSPVVFCNSFHSLSCTFCPEYPLNILVYQGMSSGDLHTVLIIFHLSRTFPASIEDSFVALLQTKILRHVCYLVFCPAFVNVGPIKLI